MSSLPNTTKPMVDRLADLSRMSAAVCQAETEPALLAAAADHIGAVFGADWAAIGLRSGDGRRVRQIELPSPGSGSLASDGAAGLGVDRPAEGLAAAEALDRGQLIAAPSLVDSPFADLSELAARDLRSAVVAPLRIADHGIGSLTLARRGDLPFSDEDGLLARQAAAFVASAIKTLRTQAEARRAETERHKAEMIMSRRATELDSLARISSALGRFSLRQAVELVCTEMASQRGIELCRISAVDNRGGLQQVASASQHGACFQDAGPTIGPSSPDALAVQTGAPVVWRRPAPDDQVVHDRLRTLGVTSVLAVPILCQGSPIGALGAGSTGGHRLVTDEHLVMAEIVGRQLAVAATGNGNRQGFWEAMSGPGPDLGPATPAGLLALATPPSG